MRHAFAFLLIFAFAVGVAFAADTSAIPDRTGRIQPGEWIILQDTSGDSTDTNKITVLDRKGDVLKLRREHFDSDGNLVGTTEHELDLKKFAERAQSVKGKAIEVTDEFIMIDEEGHEVVGVLWEDTDKDSGQKHQYKVLVSENIPISGVVRYWSSNPDAPSADVVGYGFGDN